MTYLSRYWTPITASLPSVCTRIPMIELKSPVLGTVRALGYPRPGAANHLAQNSCLRVWQVKRAGSAPNHRLNRGNALDLSKQARDREKSLSGDNCRCRFHEVCIDP